MKKNYIEILRRLYRDRYVPDKTRSNVSLSNEEKKILNELQTSGIVVIENFFEKEFCDQLIDFSRRYIDSNKSLIPEIKEKFNSSPKEYKFGVPMNDGSFFWVDKTDSDCRIIHAENINDAIKHKFYQNTFFKKMGDTLLSTDLEMNFSMVNQTSFVSGNLGSGGGWHRDNNYKNGFKVMLYLSDVTDENGPFEYLKGTFSLKNHLLHFPYPDKYQFTEEEIDNFIRSNKTLYKKVTGKAGTIVLFNTNGIHRGKPLIAGVRNAITNYYK